MDRPSTNTSTGVRKTPSEFGTLAFISSRDVEWFPTSSSMDEEWFPTSSMEEEWLPTSSRMGMGMGSEVAMNPNLLED